VDFHQTGWLWPIKSRKNGEENQRYIAGQFKMRYDYAGPGYGVVGDLEREAIRLVA